MMTRLDLNQSRFSKKLIVLCKMSCSLNLKEWIFLVSEQIKQFALFELAALLSKMV